MKRLLKPASAESLEDKIVEASIASRERYLADLKKQISQTQIAALRHQEETEIRIGKLHATVESLKEKQETVQNSITTARRELADLRRASNDLRSELNDGRIYLKSQEKIIRDAIDDGNIELRSVALKIEAIEAEKTEQNTELYRLNTKRLQAIDELNNFARLAEADRKIAGRDFAKALKELSEIKEKIKLAEKTLAEIEQETDHKMMLLRAKEKEIITKRNVLQKEKATLKIAQRRFDSAKNLYD